MAPPKGQVDWTWVLPVMRSMVRPMTDREADSADSAVPLRSSQNYSGK
jgi:hypothetical protein